MSALIYIHGFLSSPLSLKAQQVEAWLQAHRPDIHYHCPFLPAYPGESRQILDALVESLLPGPVYLMGSSLGGYWATYLGERYDLRAVLINPAVNPAVLIESYIGVALKNYHTEDTYTLSAPDIDAIKAVDTPEMVRKDNYWLLVQTQDEVLDYRLAVDKYADCKQLVEEGGDHAFQNFERWIPETIAFLEKDNKRQ